MLEGSYNKSTHIYLQLQTFSSYLAFFLTIIRKELILMELIWQLETLLFTSAPFTILPILLENLFGSAVM